MRTGGTLLAVVVLVLAGCGGKTKTVTIQSTNTTPTVTATTPATTTTPTTTTPSSGLSRLAAETLARGAATSEVARFGVSIPPTDWSADCSPAGDGYDCSVRANSGQCRGTLHVYRGPAGPVTNQRRIGCGE